MFNFKKVISLVLTLCLIATTSIPVLADSNTSEVKWDYPDVEKVLIDRSKVEVNLKQLVEDGLITAEYADKVLEIVDKYTTETSESSGEIITSDYYDPDTGAEIYFLGAPQPFHGQLMFNEAGWDIIREIINLGGGSTTIGLAIASLCGVSLTGAIAALVGGIVVTSIASVNLQFALGAPYAILYY